MMSSACLPCPSCVTALVLTVICTQPFFALAGGRAWHSVTFALCGGGAAVAVVASQSPPAATVARAVGRIAAGRRTLRSARRDLRRALGRPELFAVLIMGPPQDKYQPPASRGGSTRR